MKQLEKDNSKLICLENIPFCAMILCNIARFGKVGASFDFILLLTVVFPVKRSIVDFFSRDPVKNRANDQPFLGFVGMDGDGAVDLLWEGD